MHIKQATTVEDISKCWEVIHVLRPHLKRDSFCEQVKTIMTEGYQLAFIEVDGRAVSAIGYRYLHYLFNGKHYYIDDLVTLPAYRGQGLAGKLLDHVFSLAKEKGYNAVTLDSAHHRYDAHRLYLNKGFIITAHHFQKTIGGDK